MAKEYPHGRRGFASMNPDRQREAASKGGRAAHAKGTGHEWTSEEARQAGRKGGLASRGGRGALSPDDVQESLPADPPLLRSKDYQPRPRRKPALGQESW